MYIFENMGLLNQENKKDIIHLDYEVRVLSAINGAHAYYLIRETEQFVNDNIFRVLSDRDYAADCLGIFLGIGWKTFIGKGWQWFMTPKR